MSASRSVFQEEENHIDYYSYSNDELYRILEDKWLDIKGLSQQISSLESYIDIPEQKAELIQKLLLIVDFLEDHIEIYEIIKDNDDEVTNFNSFQDKIEAATQARNTTSGYRFTLTSLLSKIQKISDSDKDSEIIKLQLHKIKELINQIDPTRSFIRGKQKKKTMKKTRNTKKSVKNKPLTRRKNKRNKQQKGGNKGIRYENYIAKVLGSPAAGAGHDVPDAWVHCKDENENDKYYPLEVKLDLAADYGQLNLHFDHSGNQIIFPEITPKTKEQTIEYINLLNELKVLKVDGGIKAVDPDTVGSKSLLDYINSSEGWNVSIDNYPRKFKKGVKVTKKNRDEIKKQKLVDYVEDKKNFKDIKILVPFSLIVKFYSNKTFRYKGGSPMRNRLIQIGHKTVINKITDSGDGSPTLSNKSKGLYLMATKDERDSDDIQELDTIFGELPLFEIKKAKNKGVEIRFRIKGTASGTNPKKPNEMPGWSVLCALTVKGTMDNSKLSFDDDKRLPSDEIVVYP